MSDIFLFAEDDEEEVNSAALGTWKVLIVDDEPEVHAVTRLALSDFVFEEKTLEFVSAYSGDEAKAILKNSNDIAVVLLDVVMETDEAGLEVADYIRNDLDNHFTRIILRTGQPGQAPERDVIINYDINDYKSKTELTAQKLFTVIIATLRSYRDINLIEENRIGLEKIISASANLFTVRSLENFIEGIVLQLSSLLGGTKDAAYITSAVAGPEPINESPPKDFYVFAGKGEYEKLEGKLLEDVVKGEKLVACQQALIKQELVYGDKFIAAFCKGKNTRGSLLYLSGLPRELTKSDKSLIEIFAQNVQLAFDNVLLMKDAEDTQREIIERLSQALEDNFSAGKHVQRMVKMCQVIASAYGLNDSQIHMLRSALPLHDIGKLKVPAEIFMQPGPLSEQQREQIKRHAEYGYQLLKDSKRPMLKAAAVMAREHHEFWDGNGYPRQLKGEDIHIFSRITAIADVYDALRSKLHHKESWPIEEVANYFNEQKGKQFEPKLVDIVMQSIDKFERIQRKYSDQQII